MKIYCYLAAGILVLLATPQLLDELKELPSPFAAGGVCMLPVIIIWILKRKIPRQLFPWLMTVYVYGAVVLVCSARQIKRAENVWQFLILSDDTPWTAGHSLGVTFGTATLLALWKFKSPPRDSEEILSGPRLISMAEAQKKANAKLKEGEQTLFWAGIHLPAHCSTEHFAIVGTPGSGKTLSLQLLMKSILPGIAKGSHCRAVIYDAKRDTRSLLEGIFKEMPVRPPIEMMNPFDLRGVPWRMNKDIREGATAYQIASILIPKTGKETQTFFIDAARALLGGVMHSLSQLAPDDWTLRDVVLTLRYRNRMAAVLSACPQTHYLVGKYVEGRGNNDVETTLENTLRSLSFIAAAWHHSQRKPVSLEQWVESETILILGSDPTFDEILQPLNRAIFKRLVEVVRRQPEVARNEVRNSWFIIDELRNAGNLEDLDKLLVEGRSKGACVVLGFQDLPGLREEFGDKRADEILGACANKVFLQNGEGTTIDYATRHFKNQEIMETRVSYTNNSTSGTGSQDSSSQGYSVGQHRVTRPVVHGGLLKSLPKPSHGREGLAGYCDTAAAGTLYPYRMELSPQFLAENLPIPDDATPGFVPRPTSHLDLPEWGMGDLERLSLERHTKLLLHEPPPAIPVSELAGSPSPDEGRPEDEEPDIFLL